MRIACPSCAAEYEVPASRLTPRKMVRCARCGGEWIPVHTVEDVTPPPEAEPPEHPRSAPELIPAVSAMDRLAATAPSRTPRTGLMAAWVLTFVVLIGAAAATVIWREAVVRVWPASALVLGSADNGAPAKTPPGDKKGE